MFFSTKTIGVMWLASILPAAMIGYKAGWIIGLAVFVWTYLIVTLIYGAVSHLDALIREIKK